MSKNDKVQMELCKKRYEIHRKGRDREIIWKVERVTEKRGGRRGKENTIN